jgi:hypothetical protein
MMAGEKAERSAAGPESASVLRPRSLLGRWDILAAA